MRQSRSTTSTLIALTLGACANSPALASTPTLGGPMSHLLITVFQQQVYVTFESPSMATVTMQDSNDDFAGSADVLNHTGYNAQFGWLANGFISLPQGAGIYVRTISASPHLNVYEETSFQAILGTGGSSDVWRWDGTMTHNWYATDVHGPHHARYEVFVGDNAGDPLDGYQSGFVDLSFVYGPDLSGRIGVINTVVTSTPAPPAAMGLLTLGALTSARRRR